MSGGVDTSMYRLPEQPNALQLASGLATLSNAANAAEASHQAVALRKLGALHGEFSALAANPNLTLQDIQDTADRLVRAGLATPADAAREVAIAQRFGTDPAALRRLAGTHLQSVLEARDRLHSAYGELQDVDTGDNRLLRTVSPVTGEVRNLAVVPKALTPQDKAFRVQTFQGGQAGTAPTSAVTDRYGNPRTAPLGGAQAGGGSGAGGMAPAGFVPSAPSLGQARVAEGGAEAYLRDLQAAAGSGGELANLQAALGNVRALGSEGTGPGTAGRKRIASFLNSAGLGRLPGVDPKKIEDLDEATSYLASAARSGNLNPAPGQAPGAGAPTTPDLGEISQPAAINLLRAQVSLKRLQQAQARSYQGQDNGAGYAQHAASFASEQDPRAYSIDLRTPEEKRKLIQSLGPPTSPAYQRFKRSLETAHRLGLVNAGQ